MEGWNQLCPVEGLFLPRFIFHDSSKNTKMQEESILTNASLLHFCIFPLEWIPHGKMKTEGVLELANVVVRGLACVVGGMDTNTEV